MKAITVCVEYDDLLKITLATNRRLFEEYLIVTNLTDEKTVEVAESYNCSVYRTNSFYLYGAAFNKGKAMEEGFGILGRVGWICILDADILLPFNVDFEQINNQEMLYSPLRHMIEDLDSIKHGPWSFDQFPIKEEHEHAGYCQLFHAQSPWTRNEEKWYGTDWKHAGGCDSDFQKLFPPRFRKRPSWNVAHLGVDYRNWCGRISDRIDGLPILGLEDRVETYLEMLGERKPGYEGEKLNVDK